MKVTQLELELLLSIESQRKAITKDLAFRAAIWGVEKGSLKFTPSRRVVGTIKARANSESERLMILIVRVLDGNDQRPVVLRKKIYSSSVRRLYKVTARLIDQQSWHHWATDGKLEGLWMIVRLRAKLMLLVGKMWLNAQAVFHGVEPQALGENVKDGLLQVLQLVHNVPRFDHR